MRIARLTISIAIIAIPQLATAEEGPWQERFELVDCSAQGAPTDCERLAKAEVLELPEELLLPCGFPQPPCQEPGYWLEVSPFRTADGSPISEELCPSTTPFYDEPTPTKHCSGTLVGEDLILTAGHCADEIGDCTGRRFLFDFAVKTPDDPLGEDIPPQGGLVFIPLEDVFACEEIVAFETVFPPGTTAEEAFASEGEVGGDWGLLRMTEPVGVDRVPIPSERFIETAIGQQALILGHPAKIPMKGEVQALASYTGGGFAALFSTLGGSSGSGVINLHTGKLLGVATRGALPVVQSSDPFCRLAGRVDLCFTCGDVTSGTGTVILAGLIPAIGLQATPALAVDHYGPPTAPEDFAGQPFRSGLPQPIRSSSSGPSPGRWPRKGSCRPSTSGKAPRRARSSRAPRPPCSSGPRTG